MAMVYLAGKIDKNDWRHTIFPKLRNFASEQHYLYDYDIGENRYQKEMSRDGFLYRGPFFIGDDHGSMHGEGLHGRGAGLKESFVMPDIQPSTRTQVVRLCLAGIDNSSHVFCWLDEETAYGTMVELGYALSRGKYVCIALHNELSHSYIQRLQPILRKVHLLLYAESASEAWDFFVEREDESNASFLPSIVEEEPQQMVLSWIFTFCEEWVNSLDDSMNPLVYNAVCRYSLAERFIKEHKEILLENVPYLALQENDLYRRKFEEFRFVGEVAKTIDMYLVDIAHKYLTEEDENVETRLGYAFESNGEDDYLYQESDPVDYASLERLERSCRLRGLELQRDLRFHTFTEDMADELIGMVNSPMFLGLESLGRYSALFCKK